QLSDQKRTSSPESINQRDCCWTVEMCGLIPGQTDERTKYAVGTPARRKRALQRSAQSSLED
ncbi:hypothetical protein A2U01_0070994, partial [Trifolium medium]|nr:hypothetical protein [Trifolium medium]